MKTTNFIVNVTIIYLFFQTYGVSSSNTMVTPSSNVTCIEKERQLLLLFRQGFTNQSNRLSKWTGLECCEWEGVGCDRRTGQVVKLDLSFNYINSTIPAWLSNLTGLVHLNLGFNYFHGGIPPSLGGLSSLTYLYLYENQLSGSIPESIGLLTSLQTLDLSSNQLSGNIPTSLGQLSNLQFLGLSYNQLSGVVTEIHFTKLYNLTQLDLSGNQLSGVVSEDHFTKLYNLTDLSGNSLITWNVSHHWIPPFQLESLGASNMGPQFPNWLQTQTHLQYLDLSKSRIRDTIPEWFHNISSHLSGLDLSDNEIGPEFPNWLQTSTNLRYLKLRNSSIRDSIPEWFQNISSHLRFLDLSDNQIGGNLPRIIANNNTGNQVNPGRGV